MENLIDDFILKCDNCGRLRELVEFDDVPDKHKDAVRKMIDAIEPVLLSNDETPVLIAFCDKCNEYSVMCLGGSDEWI